VPITFYSDNKAYLATCQAESASKCNKCGEVKNFEDFYSHNKSTCKECIKRKSRAWYKNNSQKTKERVILWQKNHAEEVKKHDAKRRSSPEYKKKQAEFYRKWYAENGRQRAKDYQGVIDLWRRLNPEKCKTYHLVRYALKSGSLKKPLLCSKCGDERKLLGHHEDYDLPLKVKWLCYSCHKKLNHNSLFTPKSAQGRTPHCEQKEIK